MDSCTILDPAFRPPEILELIELDVTDEFTNYLADVTVDAVDCALGYAPVARDAISFKCFVRDTIRRASVQMPVLLITLVYITRSKPFLCIEVDQWACERVFLGALIVASKRTGNDIWNAQWSVITGVFGKRDVGRIEREFLNVLDWNLSFPDSDVIALYDPIIELYRNPSQPPSHIHPSPQMETYTESQYPNPSDPFLHGGSEAFMSAWLPPLPD